MKTRRPRNESRPKIWNLSNSEFEEGSFQNKTRSWPRKSTLWSRTTNVSTCSEGLWPYHAQALPRFHREPSLTKTTGSKSALPSLKPYEREVWNPMRHPKRVLHHSRSKRPRRLRNPSSATQSHWPWSHLIRSQVIVTRAHLFRPRSSQFLWI